MFSAAAANNFDRPVRLFNLCGPSQSGHFVSVPAQVRCVPPELARISEAIAVVYIPCSLPGQIPAFKCSIRKRTICTRTGILGPLGGQGVVADDVAVRTVSPEVCLGAVGTRQVFLGRHAVQLVEISPGVWTSNGTLKIQYQYCCFDFCSSTETFVLEEGVLTSMDGDLLNSNLGDMGGCRAKLGRCVTSEYVIIWEPHNLMSLCPFEAQGTYHVTVGDRHVLIEKLQVAFSYLNPPIQHPCLPRGVVMMDQGIGLLFPHGRIPLNCQSRLKLASQRQNATDSDPLNPKLQYLFDKVVEMELIGFRRVWQELCAISDRQLQLIHQWLRIDPSLGIRVFLGQDDLHAQFAGEVLMVWPCRQVVPSKIYWNYKVGSLCYEFMPVLVNETLWYQIPGSRDLVQNSEIVDCHHHIFGVFQTVQGWRSSQGYLHVQEIPLELVWKADWNFTTFNAPALFHDKLAGLEASIGLLRSYAGRLMTLQSQLNRLTNYTASLSIDPRVVCSMIRGLGEGIGLVLEGAGHALEHIIRGTASGLVKIANGLLQGPLQVIINILVIGATVVGFLFLTYLLVRFLLSEQGRDCRKRIINHKNALKNVISAGVAESKGASGENEKLPMEIFKIESTFSDKSEPPVEIDYFTSQHVYGVLTSPPLLQICVQKVPVKALLDTGSSISIISTKFYETLAKVGSPRLLSLNPPIASALSVSGHNLPLKGSSLVWLKLGKSSLPHQVQVMDNCPHDCIIGSDLFSRFGEVNLDLVRHVVQLGPDLCVPLIPPTNVIQANAVTVVHSCESVTIPPLSNMVVLGKANLGGLCGPFLFEPGLTTDVGLFLAHALVDSSPMPVNVLNNTRAPIVLFQGQTLGRASSFKSEVTHNITQVDKILEGKPLDKTSGDIFVNLKLGDAQATEEQKALFVAKLHEFEDVFSKFDGDLGRTNIVEHLTLGQ